MGTPVNHVYEFGPFQLDPPERLLLRDGQPVAMTPKAFDMLVVLVERCGHLVEKNELLKTVWHGSFVEEGNLSVTVSFLRKALNDDRGEHRYIETVSKRGYRFVADVRQVGASDTALSPLGPDDTGLAAQKVSSPEMPVMVVPKVRPSPIRREFRWKLLAAMLSLAALLVFVVYCLIVEEAPLPFKSQHRFDRWPFFRSRR